LCSSTGDLEEEWDGDTVVIYHLWDNLCYYAIDAMGSAFLPKKGAADGKYHIPGALDFADRDEFTQPVSFALPLLRAGGQHTKVLLTPLMRYAMENCCENEKGS
jgi:hypothetical protein